MKRLFVFAAALGLFVSFPAAAQNNDHHGDKSDAATSHGDRGAPPASGNRDGQGRAASGAPHAKTTDAPQHTNKGRAAGPSRPPIAVTQAPPTAIRSANKHLPNSGDAHPGQQGRSMVNKAQNNAAWNGNRANQQPTGNFQQENAARSNNHATRGRDINSLRHNMQASQHFRGGSYNAPQGYQHRRWSYGERLPRGYFAQNYWIANFVMFDLFAPPAGLIWVRVGDDALLIDQYSGDIVQVRYGVFY